MNNQGTIIGVDAVADLPWVMGTLFILLPDGQKASYRFVNLGSKSDLPKKGASIEMKLTFNGWMPVNEI